MVATHHGGPGGILHSLEVVETVMEVADMAWEAYERRRHRSCHAPEVDTCSVEEDASYLLQLREENRRLMAALKENLTLLRNLSKLPVITEDCPPDLHAQLVKAVESVNFSTNVEALSQTSEDPKDCSFPFKEVQGLDLKAVDVVVHDDVGKPTCWVWVTEELDVDKVEAESGIDDENYVIVGQDDIVDGIANFIARCILSNPKLKSLSQDDLHKAVTKCLGSMKDASILKKVWRAGNLMYSLSTWGIALAALYRHPIIVKVAVKCVVTSGKFIMKTL